MSETIQQVENRLIDNKNADPALAGLNSPSQVALWRAFLNTIASGLKYFADLLDIYKAEVETIVELSPPHTGPWWIAQVKKFQYGDAITLVNFVPTYATIDTTKQIITQVAVTVPKSKVIQIKVAKGTTPGPLAGGEISAFQAYVDQISDVDVTPNVISVAADKLWITGTIFYNGQYQATIQVEVIGAIKAFISALPFNGQVKIISIIDAIQSVRGVTDVQIFSIAARKDSTAFISRSFSLITLAF